MTQSTNTPQQQMQNLLQNLQMQYGIYNSEIEPEHDTDYYCGCPIHNYQRMKWGRYKVQDMWSRAVMYPGQHIFLMQVEFHNRADDKWDRRESIQRQHHISSALQQQSVQIPGRVPIRLRPISLDNPKTSTRIPRHVDPSDHCAQQQAERRSPIENRRQGTERQDLGRRRVGNCNVAGKDQCNET